MTIETYLLFLITTAVVVFTPGAAAITVASQGAANGGRRALAGVVGIASANVIYFALSATGIASLIIASNLLFQMIKWVGVAYLLWLGVNAIFSANGPIRVAPGAALASTRKLYVQGFVIEFANPNCEYQPQSHHHPCFSMHPLPQYHFSVTPLAPPIRRPLIRRFSPNYEHS